MAAGAPLLMAIGVAICVIPPFIAGLCGFGRRFVSFYLAILATVYVTGLAARYGLSGASSFIDDHLYKDEILTEILGTLYGSVFIVLIVSITLDVAYFSGRGLRSLTRKVTRHFRPS